MKSLLLDFSTTPPVFDFSFRRTGFDCTVQNCMVNLATTKGSSAVHPDKGTDLLKRMTSGIMINRNFAQQAVNFAALDTLAFGQTSESSQQDERLQDVRLVVKGVEDGRLDMELQVTSSKGKVVGTLTSI